MNRFDTSSNIRLLQGTTAVSSSVALSSSDGLTVTLTPAALLSPSTTYTVQASEKRNLVPRGRSLVQGH